MKLEIQLGGRARSVEIERRGERLLCRVDGRPVEADVVEVVPGTYSILIAGRAFEVRVEPRGERLRLLASGEELFAQVKDPRQWRRRGGVLELEGRQQVVAPMPGKVVRVLIEAGGKVEARQGLLVVEAMKMQNEICSPKSGVVERLLVAEGQAVNAGDVLAVVA
jgi:biotin carboxyl carrier protein